MVIVHVAVDVKPDQIDAFITATLVNAKASLGEPGIARFDVLQDPEAPQHFLLVEVYRTKDDPARHKKTIHYQVWRDTVEPMMATPRTKKVYASLYPNHEGQG